MPSDTAPAVPIPPEGDVWLALTESELPVDEISAWVVRPDCGAVVVFSGTARDHARDRPEVSRLEYEAYAEHVVPRLEAIAEAMTETWPDLGRIAMLHRTGVVDIGASSVVVAVSSPHRVAAFEAARYGIDTIKSSVPIWKRETWAGGESWGLEAQHITDVAPSGES